MIRTAPAFWWTARRGLPAHLLHPLGVVYGTVTTRRMGRPGVELPVPVICVGNLVAGGAGKTPTALALAAMLADAGHRPAFLSRGYGRTGHRGGRSTVLRVDPGRHTADQAGDEPLLLAAVAPTFVSADRVAAGRQAIDAGATVLVLDDGLQNPALAKTIALAVADGALGVGNGLCVPAGPLRAPLSVQWRRIDALCLIGDGFLGDEVARQAVACGRPVLRARLAPDASSLAALRGQPLVAFAGIGQPQKFFATLAAHGLDVRVRRAFPDHHRFSADDLRRLERDAAAEGARLVTTAKDRVRLPAAFPADVLSVALRFDDMEAVRQMLESLKAAALRLTPDPVIASVSEAIQF